MKNVRKFLRNPTAVVGLVILVTLLLIAVIGPFFVQDPFAQLPSNKLQGPSMTHLLGTDDFGRDILARIVVGARYSLTSGIFAVALGLVGGLLMGTLSGYYGGLLDHIIMTICDILLAFPSVLLAMSIVMVMQPGVYTPMVAVGLSSIPTFARLVRAQFMSLKTNSYIEAVRSSGAGDMRIIFRHLLLNSMGPIIVQATLRMGSSIMLASTLGFLGLGAQPPTPEWGSMLSEAQTYLRIYPNSVIWPGIVIALVSVALALMGNGLSEAMDPQMKE